MRQLLAVLERVGPQHPGRVRYRELVTPFAAGQRPTESELEDAFLELVIRPYNLPVPVRQRPVGKRSIAFDDIHRWPGDTAAFLDRTIAKRRHAVA